MLKKIIGVSARLQLYASKKTDGRKNKCKQDKKSEVRLMFITHIFHKLLIAYKLCAELPSGQCKERSKKLSDNLLWSAKERYIIFQGSKGRHL